MDEQPLQKPLENLQDELTRTNTALDQPHPVLQTLQRDTQSLLNGQHMPERHKSFSQRLRNAIPLFEASHPRLTEAMSQVVDALNRIGI